jgi:multiple sugar transport system permease protein
MIKRNIVITSITYIMLAIFLFWVIFPLYWDFTVSIKNSNQLFTWPPTYIPWPPTIKNYIDVMKTRPILPTMLNSIIVMAISTPVSVLFASMAAFALARFKFWGKEILRYGILFIRMLPGLIIAIPLFLMFKKIGLYDNLLCLIIAYTAFNLPFNIFMLTGFFEEIPRELEEAATIDGATAWQSFSRIMMPLAAPGLVASVIFCALLSWNEFQTALILTYTPKSETLPLIIAGMTSDRGTYFGQMGAGGMIAMLPVLALGVYVQRYLVRGLTSGALKG